jgi:hypothetical protein
MAVVQNRGPDRAEETVRHRARALAFRSDDRFSTHRFHPERERVGGLPRSTHR